MKEHWLDYATTKYSAQHIQDTKQLVKLIVIFIPTPIYWALYGQQVCQFTNLLNNNFTLQITQHNYLNFELPALHHPVLSASPTVALELHRDLQKKKLYWHKNTRIIKVHSFSPIIIKLGQND